MTDIKAVLCYGLKSSSIWKYTHEHFTKWISVVLRNLPTSVRNRHRCQFCESRVKSNLSLAVESKSCDEKSKIYTLECVQQDWQNSDTLGGHFWCCIYTYTSSVIYYTLCTGYLALAIVISNGVWKCYKRTINTVLQDTRWLNNQHIPLQLSNANQCVQVIDSTNSSQTPQILCAQSDQEFYQSTGSPISIVFPGNTLINEIPSFQVVYVLGEYFVGTSTDAILKCTAHSVFSNCKTKLLVLSPKPIDGGCKVHGSRRKFGF